MFVSQAKQFIGQECEVAWSDRNGNQFSEILRIDDVTFIPMYGACLLTSSGDIRLDRVQDIRPSTSQAA